MSSRVRRLVAFFLGALGLIAARPAAAYPWMIRHDYTACAQCHADPSGGGIVTQYGRAQGELLLRTHYSKKSDEDPGAAGKFLFGVNLPDSVLVEAVSRSAELQVDSPGSKPFRTFIQFQADLRAQVTAGKFRANGSIAYADQGALPASLTGNQKGNVVSREHWIGYDATDSVLIRAGRNNLPFGIRNIEHTFYVRSQTRTDINEFQQHGLAVAYSGSKIRTELMGIAGNFQVSPDDFRERGYSGYLEYTVLPKMTVGVSSLATHATVDVRLRRELTRTANGVFLRAAPWKPLVILAENDLIALEIDRKAPIRVGSAGVVQADLEAIQGVHLIAAGEWFHDPQPRVGTSFGAWGGVDWFFAPHADIRIDGVERDVPIGPGRRIRVMTWLGQFHFYL